MAPSLDVDWVEPEKAANAFFGIEDEIKWALIAPEINAGLTLAEMNDAVLGGSAGFIRSMNPKGTLTPFLANQTTEQSMLNAVFSMPSPTHETVVRVTATGLIANTSGGAVTYTFRLRNTTNATLLCANVVTLANDAVGQRTWRLEIVSEGNIFLADGIESVGHLLVDKGNTDPLQQSMGQGIQAVGSDPQNWDLTCQASVANANATVSVYGAQVMFALPGA